MYWLLPRWLLPRLEKRVTRIEQEPTLTIAGKVVDLGTPVGQRLQKSLDDFGEAMESYLASDADS
jgi:hypothetical protein